MTKVIGIDFSRAFKFPRTGTENFSFEIFKNFSKFVDKNFLYRIYLAKPLPEEYEKFLPENSEIRVLKGEKFWTLKNLSFEIFKNRPDVLYVLSHTYPIFLGKKNAITIFDLGWKYIPEAYSKKQIFHQNLSTFFAVKKSNLIFTDSQNAKDDLIKFFNADEKKIKVIHLGFASDLINQKVSETDEEFFLKKFSLEKKSFATIIGRVEEKKNWRFALQVLANLKKEDLNFKNFKFVFAGKIFPSREEIFKIAKEKNLKIKFFDDFTDENQSLFDEDFDVLFLGFTENFDLHILLKNSAILFHPSLFEGFGIPLLEGMSFDLPVVSSNSSSLPEAGGDSAMYFSPTNLSEATEILQKVLKDGNLQKIMTEKGREQLKKFSWEKSTRVIFESLKNLAE
ncbi:MAG: glycosyltransferase family 1 protein [Patescibacteria group bacterium]